MMWRPVTASAGSLAHGCHGLGHQPDGAAREITMAFVSTRITGGVARLAGCCEKATGVHGGKKERKKEGRNR